MFGQKDQDIDVGVTLGIVLVASIAASGQQERRMREHSKRHSRYLQNPSTSWRRPLSMGPVKRFLAVALTSCSVTLRRAFAAMRAAPVKTETREPASFILGFQAALRERRRRPAPPDESVRTSTPDW